MTDKNKTENKKLEVIHVPIEKGSAAVVAKMFNDLSLIIKTKLMELEQQAPEAEAPEAPEEEVSEEAPEESEETPEEGEEESEE